MPESAATAVAAKPCRRWFQFRLRALLIAVGLLSIPLGYLAREASIVRARKGWLATHRVFAMSNYEYVHLLGDWAAPEDFPPLLRRMLGDVQYGWIAVATDKDTSEAKRLFPEASVSRIEATKDEMPDAVKAFASKALTDEDRRFYIGHFKSALVAEQIRTELQTKRSDRCEGVFVRFDGISDQELYMCSGRYAKLELHSRDTGRYTKNGDEVSLTSELAPKEDPERFVIVTWGNRIYLVGRDRLISFCNIVNMGLPPLAFYLKTGGGERTPEGLPLVPEADRKFLLRTELRAKVTRIGKVEVAKDIPGQRFELRGPVIYVDRGSAVGLERGMKLYTLPDGVSEACVVESRESSAKLLVNRDAGNALKVGVIFSSRFPRSFDDRDKRPRDSSGGGHRE